VLWILASLAELQGIVATNVRQLNAAISGAIIFGDDIGTGYEKRSRRDREL
jgi:hypothetical protein